MKRVPNLLSLAFLFCLIGNLNAAPEPSGEQVYLDAQGVIRWTATREEVALFGANYSLPSACDYRAAGYVNANRKELVETDLAHFSRMGWTGLRLCFWGDWENADAKGNLIANDHLDLLDYAIAVAKKRGLGVLLTPITTYSSLFPDGKDSDEIQGFSKVFKKDRLGLDQAPIAAQCNYLEQLFRHVNPYTGVAYKDEPAILFVELINEPTHHPEDFAASVSYIERLAGAVRGTGCNKLLFYNLSQDFRIAPAIKASSVPGLTFAWYPTALNSGHELKGNFLRTVDHFPPMKDPSLDDHPSLVYEFDSADMNSGYMYPAMVRAFREAGAQCVDMFSYDMIATAPYNLGWQTHFLNLVYSPKKALSAVIAAEATRRLPRFSRWGDYPDNCRFGDFRVSYEEDNSELVAPDAYLYANGSTSAPPHPEKLVRIAGVGRSTLVDYSGTGAYFLDKIRDGIWRLEVYGDIVQLSDPFARRADLRHPDPQSPSMRLIDRTRPMRLKLSDLGDAYFAWRIDKPTTNVSQAAGGACDVRPGVYLLSKVRDVDLASLPANVNHVGLAEYHAPTVEPAPLEILPVPESRASVQDPTQFAADIVSSEPVVAAKLAVRRKGEAEFRLYTLKQQSAYRYGFDFAPGELSAGEYEWYVTAETAQQKLRFPRGENEARAFTVAGAGAPIELFQASKDVRALSFTRIGDDVRHGIYKALPKTDHEPAAIRIFLPLDRDATLDDYTAQISVLDRIAPRRHELDRAPELTLRARGVRAGQTAWITLVEADGTGWTTAVQLTPEWSEIRVPLDRFKPSPSVMLPLGYPGRWNYWVYPPKGRGGVNDHLQLPKVERLQISLRPTELPGRASGETWVDIERVALEWSANQAK